MDKIKQNRHGGRGERKRGEVLPPRFIKLPFFYLPIYFIYFPNSTVGWNYGNLTFLFILFYFISFLFLLSSINNFYVLC